MAPACDVPMWSAKKCRLARSIASFLEACVLPKTMCLQASETPRTYAPWNREVNGRRWRDRAMGTEMSSAKARQLSSQRRYVVRINCHYHGRGLPHL